MPFEAVILGGVGGEDSMQTQLLVVTTWGRNCSSHAEEDAAEQTPSIGQPCHREAFSSSQGVSLNPALKPP